MQWIASWHCQPILVHLTSNAMKRVAKSALDGYPQLLNCTQMTKLHTLQLFWTLCFSGVVHHTGCYTISDIAMHWFEAMCEYACKILSLRDGSGNPWKQDFQINVQGHRHCITICHTELYCTQFDNIFQPETSKGTELHTVVIFFTQSKSF